MTRASRRSALDRVLAAVVVVALVVARPVRVVSVARAARDAVDRAERDRRNGTRMSGRVVRRCCSSALLVGGRCCGRVRRRRRRPRRRAGDAAEHARPELDAERAPPRRLRGPADRAGTADAGIDLKIVEPTEAGAEQAVGQGKAEFGISMAEGVLPARGAGHPDRVDRRRSCRSTTRRSCRSRATASPSRRTSRARCTAATTAPLETELINRLAEVRWHRPSSVKHVEVGNVDYLAGLEANRFDVVWIFSGLGRAARLRRRAQAIDQIRFADHFDCIPNWYTPLFITSEKMIKERPELVREVHGRHRTRLPARDRRPATGGRPDDEGRPRDGREADPRARPTTTRPKFTANGEPFGTQDQATWQTFEQFLVDAKLLEQPVNVDDAYTNEFLAEVTRRRAGLAPAASAHTYGGTPPVEAIAALDLDVAAGELVAHHRAERLRQVDAAAHHRRSRRADARHRDRSTACAANGQPGPRRVPTAARPADAVATGARRTPRSVPRSRACARARGARRRPRCFERFGLAGFERAWPADALGRHAAAGRVAAHVPRAATRAPARRAARCPRRDHPPVDAGLAAGGLDRRRPHRPARHARCRGGAAARRPRRS